MDNNDERKYGSVIGVNIEDEMRKSYIDYAMSVIVARALPDVRDGLKPVHRRILYAMHELNLDPSKAYKKSARITGDTMGKYHPHGESSIYDALVRMAQDFSMRYMLVDGHGNFGSIDGDEAAAQRYTEARLSKISMEMLSDIDKNTVDFIPNYDEEFLEPTVLPSKIPNLLVNGSTGIAVGMATNIPPHNLTEVINAIIKMIDDKIEKNEETDIQDLIDIVKGPDFPTGATILGTNGIKQAYRTGRGKVTVRAVCNIEPMGTNRERIVVTEIPYQVNKARMLERIAELVSDKKIEGISDIRDESDRNGIKIVIELKRDANSNVVLNLLYKNSQLQDSFGINMLALVDNKPEVLNLKDILTHYLNHQKDVFTRRTIFDLNKAKKRAHILEGLLKALDFIDEVIKIIRASKDTAGARYNLIERFEFSEEQATAIVEMRLRSLTGLEKDRLMNEFNELQQLITYLQSLLEDEKIMFTAIKDELIVMKQKYGDDRRTMLTYDPGEIDYEDLIDEETSVITFSSLGYVKRIPLNTYKSQNRGGKGVVGLKTREEDYVKDFLIASTHDYLLFFTNKGRVYRAKAYEIPEAGRVAKGIAVINLLNLQPDEKIASVLPISSLIEDELLTMVTKYGVIKKTSLKSFENINKNGKIAIEFKDQDELVTVLKTDGKQDIFMATKKGIGIRFNESEVRVVGRSASGVSAISLSEDDIVIGADTINEDCKILFVSEGGFGKCTDHNEFKTQHRNGKGLKIYKRTDKTGDVVCVSKVYDNEELMIITSEGIIIRIRIADISTQGRVTQGIKLINLGEGVKVISIAKINEEYLENAIDEAIDEAIDGSQATDEPIE